MPPSSGPGAAPTWAAVRGLFERALALDEAGRAALLADAALDPALVAEVRSLLAHEVSGSDGSFLARPATVAGLSAGDASAAAEADRSGQQLGAWRLVRKVGAGGMGDVWLAERADGSYSGRAAVKLLKRGMDSAAVLQRFAQERQALARLAHPHIARLLDAGASDDGLPYFVMEYVDGRPVHEAALGQPLEQRLKLFLQLADAVSHAHRNLLVHRDLKPGNVLVGADGQVKLLDFGIAKALDPLESGDGHTTVGGARPYTPHYASPEQVRGEPVSTATDIYSLGVLLYQMLTGARPTGRQATTPMEAARAVLEEAPTRPSRLSGSDSPDPQWLATRRRLEGDLDNILLKALEKAAERRYASVDALAADVSAYLEGRPVSARAASPGYVLAKFVQRNRWPVLAGSAGALGLVTALAATVLQGRMAAALGVATLAAGLVLALVQARRAQLAGQEAARARDEARAQLDRLKRVTTDLVFRYGDTVSLLPGGGAAQEALLRESVAALEPALQGAPDDLDLVTTMVAALGRLAEIQGNTAVASPRSAADARATVERALLLADRAWPLRFGDWRFASWTVRTLVVQAQGLISQGQLEEAASVLLRAESRAQQAREQQHDGEALMYTATAVGNVQLLLAQLYDHPHRASLQRTADALQAYRRAETVFRELLLRTDVLGQLDRQAAPGDASSEGYLLHQIGTILGGRALLHLQQEELDEAAREIDAAVQLRRRNVEREPRLVYLRAGLMTESGNRARILLRLGRSGEALEASALAWSVLQDLAHEEGPDSKWAGTATQALMAAPHGRALLAGGRAGEALQVLDIGARHWQAELLSDAADAQGRRDAQLRLAQLQLAQADAMLQMARPEESVLLARQALQGARFEAEQGKRGRDALLLQAEAQALLLRLQPAEAESHRQAAVAALRAVRAWQPPGRLGADHERLLAALQGLPD